MNFMVMQIAKYFGFNVPGDKQKSECLHTERWEINGMTERKAFNNTDRINATVCNQFFYSEMKTFEGFSVATTTAVTQIMVTIEEFRKDSFHFQPFESIVLFI